MVPKGFFANINMMPETMLISSTMKSSMKSSTTPWEPVTLFSGFMLMLAKNPFRSIDKHPFPLSVQKIIRNGPKMWKLWIYMLPTLFQMRLYIRRLDKIRNFAKFNILSVVTDIISKTQNFKSCRGLSGEVYNHPRHYLKG